MIIGRIQRLLSARRGRRSQTEARNKPAEVASAADILEREVAPGQALAEQIRSLYHSLEATRIHTWHLKETDQATLLTKLAGADGRYQDPKRLLRAYAQVYSQNCEDGCVAEVFSRIGEKSRTFLEIGIENGLQNTTRFLLEQGWSGFWIEGNAAFCEKAKELFSAFIQDGKLTVIHSLAAVEDINHVLDRHNVPSNFDYISIDIDRNTSHLWRALNRTARVSCIEYNASVPPVVAVEVPYLRDAAWDGSNHFGGSLKAMELIGRKKGMSLVGCDLQGVNAFFVATDETGDKFREPFTAENHYEIPKYIALTHLGHPPASTARRWVTAPEQFE